MPKKKGIYNFNKNKNWGLWECENNDSYINLYRHNNEVYFSLIFNRSKNNYGNFPAGAYVSIGKYEIKDKWVSKLEYWNPFILRYHVDAYYANESAYPIKKATIYEIVEYVKRVEQLSRPTYVVPFDQDDNYSECFSWIDVALYRLSCETDPLPEYFPLKRYSVEDYLNKNERKYGDEMLKRCYLNPFEFEKEYPHLIKETSKKWWHFFR